jgi:hypothetical protein
MRIAPDVLKVRLNERPVADYTCLIITVEMRARRLGKPWELKKLPRSGFVQ